MTEEAMTMQHRSIGELECTIVDTPGCDEDIRTVVLLCHGFGAPGDDLVPCASELYGSGDVLLRHVQFVFPAAPIQLDMGGLYDSRAWWPIDMVKLQTMMESGQTRDMRKEIPEFLETRRQQVAELIEVVTADAGVQVDKLVLGGFSQGAMLATEVALSMPQMPGGLIVWSGTLLNEEKWRAYSKSKSGLRVVQSHGTIDPILPFAGAELLRGMLQDAGIEPEFIEFHGQHTIPRDAISKASELIAQVLGD